MRLTEKKIAVMKQTDVGITSYVVFCIIENDVRRHLKINSPLKNDKIEVV